MLISLVSVIVLSVLAAAFDILARSPSWNYKLREPNLFRTYVVSWINEDLIFPKYVTVPAIFSYKYCRTRSLHAFSAD